MNCNSCNFPIGEKETIKECGQCGRHTHAFCLIPKGGEMVCDLCLIKATEEKPSYEFELPEHIRRTNIETYRKCPYKFKLEVLEGHQQPPRTYTQVGVDCHDIFEKALLDRSFTRDLWEKEYATVFLPKQEEMGIYESEEEKQAFNKRVEDCFTNFELILPTLHKPFKTEETIFFEVGEGLPKVRFTMDAIFENESGGLDLVDWKTGKELVGKQLAEDLQAPIYIHGVEKEYGKRVDSFTFYYLKEGKVRKFVRSGNGEFVCVVGKREYFIRLDEMIAEIQRLFSHIKKGNFKVPSDVKKMFFACKMCHLREQGLCLGADQQAWVQLNGGGK